MYGAAATNPFPFGPRFTPATTAGAVALAAAGVTVGALATRAAMRRWGRPALPALTGEAGSLMIGTQDATWYVESSVGADPPAWTWVVRTLPAGEFLESSASEFPTADTARADLAAYGAQKGWVFA